VAATLLVAAHGTRSAAGLATTQSLVAAIAAARPSVPVSLCFLDVAAPSLGDALDSLGATPVIVVPLLLSAGYHVLTDIPSVVAGRSSVRVAAHLGPDPLIISAVADRLASVSSGGSGSVALAAIESSQPSARDEVAGAAAQLSEVLGRDVSVLPLGSDVGAGVDELVAPVDVAVYLLAEGGFLTSLRSAVAGRGVVAEPIGVHGSLVSLVWARYDEAAAS
jgi:sirohydrochlorin ferrochelatase